jgi:hypothetical protein
VPGPARHGGKKKVVEVLDDSSAFFEGRDCVCTCRHSAALAAMAACMLTSASVGDVANEISVHSVPMQGHSMPHTAHYEYLDG